MAARQDVSSSDAILYSGHQRCKGSAGFPSTGLALELAGMKQKLCAVLKEARGLEAACGHLETQRSEMPCELLRTPF